MDSPPAFSNLLELAASDDLDAFLTSDENPDLVGLWYTNKQLRHRTPIMLAATYSSLNVLRHLVAISDVNRQIPPELTSPLHCAAAAGSIPAVEILLAAGADPNLLDSSGRRPSDVIFSLNPETKKTLRSLLTEAKDETFVENTWADPTLPDIKNTIYASDEFRMYSCKIQPCSRAYSHDWTECPFAHPGENARRRDPRKYHYSCVPCPDFRKGMCRRGDHCEYAHGVFECYLHPAQYRTRPCKEGTSCNRRVCFFAHTPEELRPVYDSNVGMMDIAGFGPGSPLAMSPRSPNGVGGGWNHSNFPNLSHLNLNNLQSSRLRASLNAEEFARLKAVAGANLDEYFAAELQMSPRYNLDAAAVFSAAQKSALINQLQQLHQQQQRVLSPIKTGVYSPRSEMQHSSLLQASLGAVSPGRMSPRGGMEQQPISPIGTRLSAFGQIEKQQQLRSLSSRDLGGTMSPIVGSPVGSSLANWASPSGKLDWAVNGEEISRLRQSNGFESALQSNSDDMSRLRQSNASESAIRSNGNEPDISWVQSLVKETPHEAMSNFNGNGASGRGGEIDGINGDMNNLNLH